MKWNTIDTLPPEGRVVLGCFGGTVTECSMFGDMWLSTDFGEIEPEYWMHMPEPPDANISLPERCNRNADQLDQLAAEFKQLGWEGHRLRVVDLAGHLRIYAHQINSKEKWDKS